MLRSFLIFVTFTFPSICFGDYEWKLITTTENSDFYVDMKSLTIKDNKRFYLRLRDYKKIDKYGEFEKSISNKQKQSRNLHR